MKSRVRSHLNHLGSSHAALLAMAAIWIALGSVAGVSRRGLHSDAGLANATGVSVTPPLSHPLLPWILGKPLDFSKGPSATPVQWAETFLGENTDEAALSTEMPEDLGREVFAQLRELHPELTLPETLSPNVLLWSRVYSEWSSRQFVAFDEKHPDRIYDVLDFRDLESRSRNAIAFEITLEQELEKRRRAFKTGFDELGRELQRQRGVRATRLPLHAALEGFNPARLKGEALKVYSTLKDARCRDAQGHTLADYRGNLRFQRGQRDQVLIALLRFETYRPWVEEIFRREGVPIALSRLALVESSFNWKATSRVGAVGVWQFMPQSASAFLNQNSAQGIDERRSVIKSAVAAARLLRQNQRVLGNWSLAVVAYNAGMGSLLRIPKALRQSGDFESVMATCSAASSARGRGRGPALGFASRNYLAEFLAMTLVEDEREQVFGTDIFRGWAVGSRSLHGRYVFERVGPGSAALSFRGLIARKGGTSPRWSALNPEISNPSRPLPRALWIARPLDDGEGDKDAQRVTTLITPGEVASSVDQRRAPPSDST